MVSVYDFIRTAALVIGIGYTAQQDRKTWMWGDSVLWGAYSLGLFLFPGYMFPGAESAMMSYMVRLLATAIIGTVTFEYLSRRTRDECVIGATLWARLMSSVFVLIVLLFSYSQYPDKFTGKTLYFDLEAFALLFLSTVYQFWRGEYRVGGREAKGHLSTLTRILFLLLFFTGLMYIAFPTWCMPYYKLNPMEIVVARVFGAFVLGRSFVYLYAPSFRYDDDRKNFFISIIVAQVMFVTLLNLAYFSDDLFDARQMLSLHVGLIFSVLAILGLYQLRNMDDQSDYFLRSKSN